MDKSLAYFYLTFGISCVILFWLSSIIKKGTLWQKKIRILFNSTMIFVIIFSIFNASNEIVNDNLGLGFVFLYLAFTSMKTLIEGMMFRRIKNRFYKTRNSIRFINAFIFFISFFMLLEGFFSNQYLVFVLGIIGILSFLPFLSYKNLHEQSKRWISIHYKEMVLSGFGAYISFILIGILTFYKFKNIEIQFTILISLSLIAMLIFYLLNKVFNPNKKKFQTEK